MPYTVNWYIPNEVLYIRYTGVMTIEEFRESQMEKHALMNSSPRDLVHTISDAGDISEGAPVIDTLRVLREVGNHPRTGWTLSIREESTIVKLGTALGSSLFKARFRSFHTLDQAIAHLKAVDETLSWDKVEANFIEPKEG